MTTRLASFTVIAAAIAAMLLVPTSPFAQTRRTATVCNPGNRCFSLDTTTIGGRRFEDYRVTNGSLLNAPQRRAILQTNIAAGTSLCGVSPYIGQEATLPTLRWRSATVNINTHTFTNSAGRLVANQSAPMAFEDLQTSDGYSAPRFGFFLVREVGTTVVHFQFRPTVDRNLSGIPGLTEDLNWVLNTSTHQVVEHPALSQLPVNLRRLLLALAFNLPDLYRRADRVSVEPNAQGLPVWTLGEVVAAVTRVSQLVFQVPVVTPAPIRTLTCDNRPVPYTSCAEEGQVNDFAKFLMKYGGQYVYTGDAASRQSLLETYRNWAAADALRTYPGFDPGDRSQSDVRLKFTLNYYVGLPLTLTWSALRGDAAVTDGDRNSIDAWLSSIFAFSATPYNGATEVSANNHGYLMASVKMAWGIVSNDHGAFARGVERYFIALHQMHDDGGFMWEVGRGACAIRYQALATGMLVAIAEIAASQGYDLYSLEVEGRTIHTAIQFLVDAIADPSDPSRQSIVRASQRPAPQVARTTTEDLSAPDSYDVPALSRRRRSPCRTAAVTASLRA